MRPYTVAYAALVSLAGSMVVGPQPTHRSRKTWQAALVTMCGWLAAHYLGDYFDRDLDALSKPGRPLPSGRVSPREAIGGAVTLIGVGLVGALGSGRVN